VGGRGLIAMADADGGGAAAAAATPALQHQCPHCAYATKTKGHMVAESPFSLARSHSHTLTLIHPPTSDIHLSTLTIPLSEPTDPLAHSFAYRFYSPRIHSFAHSKWHLNQ
jgi:hypothetical protein